MFLFSVRLWCYAAFAAGIGFSILAMVSGAYFFSFQLHSLVTTGTITSVDVHPDGDKNLYCPHFRFEAANKQPYTGGCRIWEGAAAPPFSVGDVVSIRYRKSNPSDAWLEAQVQDVPNDSAMGGVCGLGVGFALLWYARRRGISLSPF
jgi:hypothetical protein